MQLKLYLDGQEQIVFHRGTEYGRIYRLSEGFLFIPEKNKKASFNHKRYSNVFVYASQYIKEQLKDSCPVCSATLVRLSSTDLELCSVCGREFNWKLKDGQESILVEGKVGGRE